jgi:hypothetical protein
VRVLLAIVASLAGAVAGAAGLGFLLAYIFTEMYGTFEGSAAMGGFSIGMPLGALIGFGLGLWLVLRAKAPSNRQLVLWLIIILFIMFVTGAYIWQYA